MPIWLVAAVVGGTIIGAYFFRKREKVVEVPAISPWMDLGRAVHVSALGAIARSLPSLLTQLLVIALLCLAVWNPFATPPGTRQVAIVLDLSATMQTEHGAGSRFDLARSRAAELLKGLPAETSVQVIGAAHQVMMNRPEATTLDTALADLAAMRPLDVDSDLLAAIRSLGYLAADPLARVVVFSDFSGTDPLAVKQSWSGKADLELIRTGEDVPDAGITNLWITDEIRDRRIGVAIGSRGMDGREATVRLMHGTTVLQTKTVRLDSQARVTAEFAVDVPSQTQLEVRIDPGGGLKINDNAFVVTPPARTPVVLISTGNTPLERALRADASTPLRVVTPQHLAESFSNAVVVLDGTCGPYMSQWDPSSFGAAAGLLMVGTGDPAGRVTLGNAKPVTAITHWAASHPMLADVAADVVKMENAFPIRAGESQLRPLVSADDMPVIAELKSGTPSATKAVYWLFDLARTDLPDRVTFPVLLWNTIDYLSPPSARMPLFRTGAPFVLPLVGSTAATVTDPDGKPVPARQEGDRLRIPGLERQGFYSIRSGDSSVIATNLFTERPFAPLPEVPASRKDGTATEPGGKWWHWSWRELLGLAAVLMVVEWFFFKSGLLRLGGR